MGWIQKPNAASQAKLFIELKLCKRSSATVFRANACRRFPTAHRQQAPLFVTIAGAQRNRELPLFMAYGSNFERNLWFDTHE
jgi:hypothetical protein